MILAKKVNALLHPSQAKGERQHSLRSVATSDLIQVLREYENERKSRTRLITVRSNLMGQALQIPFAPVSHFDSWQQHIYNASVFYRPRVIWCILHQVKHVNVLLLQLSVQTEWLCNSAIAQTSFDNVLQVCSLRNFVVRNIYSPRHFLDHANYDCGQLT